MNYEIVIMGLCGLGIFIFSLRYLNSVLDETLAMRWGPILKFFNRGQVIPFLVGLLITSIVQVSGITIFATMGLLGRSLLSLETAIFMMLGASVGTTLKFWFWDLNLSLVGPGLIVFASFLLIDIRNHFYRRNLEIIMSLGFLFLGWRILQNEFRVLSETQLFMSFINHDFESGILSLILPFVLGLLFSFLFQSSSTVIIFVIELTNSQKVPFLMGAGLVLGANIGTTLVEMLASFEYSPDVKRLAFAHFLVKVIGSIMALLFFKTFLQTIQIMFYPLLQGVNETSKLAAVHTGLNIINVTVWWIFNPILVRFTKFAFPAKDTKKQAWKRPNLQKLLVQLPQQALYEMREQLENLIEIIKAYEDFLILKLKQKEVKNNFIIDPREINESLKSAEKILLGLIDYHPSERPMVGRILRLFTQLDLIFKNLEKVQSKIDGVGKKKMNLFLKSYPKLLKEWEIDINLAWKDCLKSIRKVKLDKTTKDMKAISYYEKYLYTFSAPSKAKTTKQFTPFLYELFNNLEELHLRTLELSKELKVDDENLVSSKKESKN